MKRAVPTLNRCSEDKLVWAASYNLLSSRTQTTEMRDPTYEPPSVRDSVLQGCIDCILERDSLH